MGLKITGFTQVAKYLKNKQNKLTQSQKAGIKEAIMFVQNEVKLSIAGRKAEPTSVDTGRLLNSVDTRIENNDGVVFTDISYSKFLEFGTSRIKPRRHFNNTKDRSKLKIKSIIQNRVDKV